MVSVIYPESNEARPPVITVGRIIATTSLDREDIDLYFLAIVAMDTSGFPLNTTATVVIEVSDRNDNRPLFSQANFTFDVVEGTYDDENTLISEFPVSVASFNTIHTCSGTVNGQP